MVKEMHVVWLCIVCQSVPLLWLECGGMTLSHKLLDTGKFK